MAMTLDSPSLSIDLPPLPNPHVRADLGSAAHPQVRRVSSESQTPGRASPSLRISRRTPVPFLLEAFPAPPSHIPGTPATVSPTSILNGSSLLASVSGRSSSASTAGAAICTSPVEPSSPSVASPCSPKPMQLAHNNPPPSLPPTGPLPPVPGPSTVMPFMHRPLQTTARSASPALSMAESRRSQSRSSHRQRPSLDVNDPVRGRCRQNSLSSLRNPIYPTVEQSAAIVEEPVEASHPPPRLPPPPSQSPPLFGSVAERKRPEPDSPEFLRACVAAPALRADGQPDGDDSIAHVDMSDLNALRSDNEAEGDDQASRPFPQCPPLPRPLGSPMGAPPSASLYNHAPRKPSTSSAYSIHVRSTSEDVASRRGAISPEITQIISVAPRSRKCSAPSRSRDSSSTRHSKDSSGSRWGNDVPPVPSSSYTVKSPVPAGFIGGEDTGEEANLSDASLDLLDLHTPLPQLMLRQGMLSPNSKLLPQGETDSARLSIVSSASYLSNASNLSLMSTASTSSKHPKDARDTLRRRVRHRDGKLLRGGIGLTTGLGWSDSEDEDAPSPLTRRVSTLILSRRASSSSIASYRTTRSQPNPIARSVSHSILRQVDEHENEHGPDEFGYPRRSILATRSLPSRSNPASRVTSIRSNESTLRNTPNGRRARAGSASGSSIYSASRISRADSAPSTDVQTLMPGIREQDDGVTPTRESFERSSFGSLNGGSGGDFPHTPSSTASTASLPFPATPESAEGIPPLQSVYNQDKTLPPLPLSVKAKYPSTLGLRSHVSSGLQRPRTYSSASSVSNSSMLGVPSRDAKSSTGSSASTPRPSLAERPVKISIPAGSSRPSFGNTPRPSLTIPNSPLPPQVAASGLPRPTTPSLSPNVSGGQGYTPRPLRLVSRATQLPSPISPANVSTQPPTNQVEANQSPNKSVQPGEQLPRPGQVLTYNRNVHDQLKLRTISLNTGPNRTHTPIISPGGTQTLFMPTPVSASRPNSPLVSTPVTARSQSPMSCPSPGGESRPRPRTGTGMTYRTNLSVGPAAVSRIRVPSTVSR